MRLKIRRLDDTVPLPTYGTDESAGFDLAAAHDGDGPQSGPSSQHWLRRVAKRPDARARTGCAFLGIFARSSTPLKRGLSGRSAKRTVRPALACRVAQRPDLGVGVIDPDYSGPNDEVMIQVLNFTTSEVHVARGDRLAQGIVLPAPRVTWEEVTDIREATRGGFGATGA